MAGPRPRASAGRRPGALSLAVVLLFALALAIPFADATQRVRSASVELTVRPDPPIEAKPVTVEASIPEPISNLTAKVCTYDRARSVAVVCLVPIPMERTGHGFYAATTGVEASKVFEAGGTLGVNLSYDYMGWSHSHPIGSLEYVLFDIAPDPDAKATPASGAAAVLFALGLAAAAFLGVRRRPRR